MSESNEDGGHLRVLTEEHPTTIGKEWAAETGCELQADDEPDYDPRVCSKTHTGRCWPCEAMVMLEARCAGCGAWVILPDEAGRCGHCGTPMPFGHPATHTQAPKEPTP